MTASETLMRYASPEEAGVSSKGLLCFLKACEEVRDQVQFHSLMLLRHGKIVCTMNWAPYDEVTPHTLYSLSKSFCSAAAGFAVAEGKLTYESRVVDILRSEVPAERVEDLKAITLEHLLCMGSGLDPVTDQNREQGDATLARAILSLPPAHPPMTHFHYNTMGTYLISCMVQEVTGETIRDYLVPRLFGPLGIETPQWDMSKDGICYGGFGLHLSCEAIARFGQCLQEKGRWQGKQILPEGWVEKATAWHIDNSGGTPQPDNEWAQGYGFQFWRCIDGRYRGDGMYGQICMVDDAKDAVLAVTCGTHDMGREYEIIRRTLFPAMEGLKDGETEETEALNAAVRKLGYPLPENDGSAAALPEGTFASTGEGMEQLSHLSLRKKEGTDCIELSFKLRFTELFRVLLFPEGEDARQGEAVGHYAWQKGALLISLRATTGPSTWEGRLSWRENEVLFEGLGIDFPNGRVVFARETDPDDR